MGFLDGSVVKNPPAPARDTGDEGLTHVSGRSSGIGNGNPLQYSFLGNSMDRGSWQAKIHGVGEVSDMTWCPNTTTMQI